MTHWVLLHTWNGCADEHRSAPEFQVVARIGARTSGLPDRGRDLDAGSGRSACRTSALQRMELWSWLEGEGSQRPT